MKIIQVEKLKDIRELRDQYMKELPYVQDLNAEENVWECNFYKIYLSAVCVGYCCVDSQKTLWEFYLIENALIHAQEVFKFLIDQNYIVAAEVKTYDHLLISLCFDYHKKAECSAYLFRKNIDIELPATEFNNVSLRLATNHDFDLLSEINDIDEGVNFFHDLKKDIGNNEVLIFFSNNEFIGAGTVKKVWNNMNYYDIGMVVPEKHRRKGIGTLILVKLKEYCNDHNYIPVCGCWYYNHSSKKTLEKAGFLAEHRMIRFSF